MDAPRRAAIGGSRRCEHVSAGAGGCFRVTSSRASLSMKDRRAGRTTFRTRTHASSPLACRPVLFRTRLLPSVRGCAQRVCVRMKRLTTGTGRRGASDARPRRCSSPRRVRFAGTRSAHGTTAAASLGRRGAGPALLSAPPGARRARRGCVGRAGRAAVRAKFISGPLSFPARAPGRAGGAGRARGGALYPFDRSRNFR